MKSAIKLPTPDPPEREENLYSPDTAAEKAKFNKKTKMTASEKREAELQAKKRAEKKAAKARTASRRKASTPPPPSPPPKKKSAAASKKGIALKVAKARAAETGQAATKALATASTKTKASTKAITQSTTKSAAIIGAGTKTQSGRVTKSKKDSLSKEEEKNIKKHLTALNNLVKRLRDDDEGAFTSLIDDLADFGERFRAIQRGEFVRERLDGSEEEGAGEGDEESEEELSKKAVRGRKPKRKAVEPKEDED